jgi:hypothetical protein
MPDVRMIIIKNYYSKVGDADVVECSHDDVKKLLWLSINGDGGSPDVRMIMTKNYYSKVDNEVSCEYCRIFA